MDAIHHIQLVAIGASAGGVEAVGKLLEALPADSTLPVVIALHLPPGRPSLLAELFGRITALPVLEAADKAPLSPGTVTVAVPDYHVLVEPGGLLSLSCDPPVNYSRPSLDLLFESAAMAYRERLLAILLTGANADGSAGAQTVRQQGGVVWVQDPDEALANAMPLAAIKQGSANRVLRLAEMAKMLAEVAKGASCA
jgi:two-component system chemotaxis response regulator CheB